MHATWLCILVYLTTCTCNIIMYTCKLNYVYMQDDYVYMYTWSRIHVYSIMYTCNIYIYIYIYICIYIYAKFDAVAQASDYRIEKRQVVFLCWMQDSIPQGLWNRISSRLNARWQSDWAIEDQAKNLNSTAGPYDQRAFGPLDPTAVWPSHLALAICIFAVVISMLWHRQPNF